MDAPAQRYSSDYLSGQSLYSFLGSNAAAKKEYQKDEGKKYPYPLAQSFKTAAELFSPIEQTGTVGIIVYYKDSKAIIERFYSVSDPGEKKKLLRKLQRYSVTISASSGIIRALEEQSAFESLFFQGGVLILTESCYHPETGVDTSLQPLIF